MLMPFGRKPTPAGFVIDFDCVYADLIAPAVSAASLEPLRADELGVRHALRPRSTVPMNAQDNRLQLTQEGPAW